MADNPWNASSNDASESGTDNPLSAGSTPEAEADTSNPWGTAGDQPSEPGADSNNAWNTAPAPGAEENQDWLSSAPEQLIEETPFDFLHPFQEAVIPLAPWVDSALMVLVENFRPVFQAIRVPIDSTLTGVETLLQGMPDLLVIALFALVALKVSGRGLAIATIISLATVGLIGAWQEAMVTLSLVLTSVFFCVLIGLPTGIWLSRSDRALKIFRPILDAMQTTPAFVYLVPIVMLFGIGNVPGVVVTIIFALPPLIRLTNLGIRQVPEDLIEAARSFGASNRQLLFRVQLPLAMPTIMAGINQTLMLTLSMVVIASMIAVGGLGQMVLRGIGRLDMGLATVGGLGIVLLAIVLDRLTQSMGVKKRPTRSESKSSH